MLNLLLGRTRQTPELTSHSGQAPSCLKCNAACCKDVRIPYSPFEKPKDPNTAFSEYLAQETPWHDLKKLQTKLSQLPHGVYFAIGKNGQRYVVIKGSCPYLDENNLCTLHPNHPDNKGNNKPAKRRLLHCLKLKPGSWQCLMQRRKREDRT